MLTYARTYYHWDDVRCPQPALLVLAENQTPLTQSNRPTVLQLQAHVVIYFKNQDPSIQTDTIANNFADAIANALRVQPGEQGQDYHTTLGGAVRRAWVTDTAIFQGIPLDQSMVMVTVEMLL